MANVRARASMLSNARDDRVSCGSRSVPIWCLFTGQLAQNRWLPSPTRHAMRRSVARVATDPRRDLGALGEQLASEHLERHGFTVMERNYRTRWGELDVIAFDGRV